MNITEAELAFLSMLGTVHLLPTDIIHHRYYNPESTYGLQYCRKRLRLMNQAGLIETTHIRIQSSTGRPRPIPSVHRLTVRGADHVEEITGVRPPRPARSDPPRALTILHRLGIVEALLAFHDSAEQLQLPSVKFLMEQDVVPGAKPTAKLHQRRTLYELFSVSGSFVPCRPDASVLVTLPTADGQLRLALYIEHDRSTETERQILAKEPGYACLLHEYHFRRHWPDAHLARVLFVCRSPERIANLQSWLANAPGREHYRFCLRKHLNRNVLQEPIWVDLDNRPKVISLQVTVLQSRDSDLRRGENATQPENV